MFPTTCTTTASFSEPGGAVDRYTVSARSPYVGGIPSRAIGHPGTMFVTLGENPESRLGPNHYQPFPKVTNISLESNLHSPFIGMSGLLPLINLSLSHSQIPTTRNLSHYRQHSSTPPIIKYSSCP